MAKTSKSKDSPLKTMVMNFHCGERWKQLAILKGKDKPSYWARVLGFKHRNQIYQRWAKPDLDAKELILVCDDLRIRLSDFFEFEQDMLTEPLDAYRPKVEDRVGQLEQIIKKQEKLLLDLSHKLESASRKKK